MQRINASVLDHHQVGKEVIGNEDSLVCQMEPTFA